MHARTHKLNDTAYYTNAMYTFYLAVTSLCATYGIKLEHFGNTKIPTGAHKCLPDNDLYCLKHGGGLLKGINTNMCTMIVQ